MEQRKRPGRTDGMGYFTSWENNLHNGCIYCGCPATTREHVPSKAFLTKPYPENMSIVPACFECNNGYSNDEKYVACYLDVLKEAVVPGYHRKENTLLLIEKDKALQQLISEQIVVDSENGVVRYKIDEERLRRILLKLAKGHAGFEFDHVCFDDAETSIEYNFAFNMTDEERNEFNTIPLIDKAPEVGSRGCITPFVLENIQTGELMGMCMWNDVQDEQYRYQMSYNEKNGVCVKIVIYELLYAKIDFI